jgi:hypothetical protein
VSCVMKLPSLEPPERVWRGVGADATMEELELGLKNVVGLVHVMNANVKDGMQSGSCQRFSSPIPFLAGRTKRTLNLFVFKVPGATGRKGSDGGNGVISMFNGKVPGG